MKPMPRWMPLILSLLFIACSNLTEIKEPAQTDEHKLVLSEENFPKIKFHFINSKSHGLDRMEAAYKTPELGIQSRQNSEQNKKIQEIKGLRKKLNQLEAVEFSDWEANSGNFDRDYKLFQNKYKKDFKSNVD